MYIPYHFSEPSVEFIICLPLLAQLFIRDAGNSTSEPKILTALGKKLNRLREDLIKLELQLSKKTDAVEVTTRTARKSLDVNKSAAFILMNNPLSKKLMAMFSRSAGVAFRDARKAQKAINDLHRLKRDIEIIKSRITNCQQKIASLTQS